MPETHELKQRHFAFGKNWTDFLAKATDNSFERSKEGLVSLLPAEKWRQKRVIDIGCGSGLHSLAALNLGAAFVEAVDYDPHSVTASRQLLERYAPSGNWTVKQDDVLSPKFNRSRKPYDIVYSWGVPHHTGDMWAAVDNAAKLVTPGGHLVLGLYKETPLCAAWRAEKRLFSKLPKPLQWPIIAGYITGQAASLIKSGINPISYIRGYGERGMRYMTDVYDWLGGYPYQSASPESVQEFLEQRGLKLEKSRHTEPVGMGWLGTENAEYVFKKNFS